MVNKNDKDKEIIINKPSFKWQKNKKPTNRNDRSYHPAKNQIKKKHFDKK